MPKPLTALAALLGAAIAVADGKLELTDEQATTLEDALAGHTATVNDLNAKIADKDAKIAKFEAKIDDLAKEPASNTDSVTESSKDTNPLNGLDIDKVCDALCSGLH